MLLSLEIYFSTTASPSMILSWEVGGDDNGWYGLTWRVGTERKIPGTKSLSNVDDDWVFGKMRLLSDDGVVSKDGTEVVVEVVIVFERSVYSERGGLTVVVWVVTTILRGVVVVANDDIVIVLWSTVSTWW